MEYSLMEMFADPSLIGQLTFGERMVGSLVTMCMGMGVTFAILFMLWGIFAVMARINVSVENKAKAAAAPTPQPQAAVQEAAPATDDSQLVAVIAASVAAAEGTAVNNLIVRRIVRLSGQATAWDDAGRSDGMAMRKL